MNNFSPIRSFFEQNDRFAAHNHINLVSVSDGRAVAEMQVQDFHRNGANVVHGGALFTLADFAFAAACNSSGQLSLAVNATIYFIRAGKDGLLTAEAVKVSENPKLGVYNVRIKDEAGEVVAEFEGMAYRKNQPLPGMQK